MDLRRIFIPGTWLAAALAMIPAPAQAAVGFAQASAGLAGYDAMRPCSTAPAPALNPVRAAAPVSMDKASAILGGQVSQLELIRRQQAGETTGFASAHTLPQTVLRGASPLEQSGFCQHFALPTQLALDVTRKVAARPLALPEAQPRGEDFLQSRRLTVSRTSFDADWARVNREGLSRSLTEKLLHISGGKASTATLGAVNAWANTRIRYVEDSKLYGKADYWAGARTTLNRRAGDCEDIAIAKMQILASLGVKRSDMYLTITRDLVRRADHAVLVVNLDGKYWLLDNATNELLDASRAHDYRPIMSFSGARKWLHGYLQL